MEEIAKYETKPIQIEEVKEKHIKLRKQKTPKKIIRKRPGKGGKVFNYITRKDVLDWLDNNFIFWSVKVKEYATILKTLNVKVEVEVVDEYGIKRSVEAWGTAEYNNNETGQFMKIAETDGLKRCAVLLGGFNDVYFEGTDIEEEDTSTTLEEYNENIFAVLLELYKQNKYDLEKCKAINIRILNNLDNINKYSEILKNVLNKGE